MYRKLDTFWKKASFIPYSRSTSWQQAGWIWRNKPFAEQYWDEVDVVYCPAESYVPTRKANLVCTIHDVAGFEESLYPQTLSRRLHCRKWRFLFGSMARHADAVITVSEFSASRIAHFFPALEKKLRVVYNAPHHVFGTATTEELQGDVKTLSGGKPYILVPGGLSLRKNAELILKSVPLLAKRLPGVRLIIAGKNEQPYLGQLNALNADNITLAGYVSDELLNVLYQDAAAVWFPSRYEGFGMPVIEAMVSGAAVVASKVASIPEVAGKAALLCDVDTPGEHVEALQSLLESDSARNELRERGLEQAGQFTWSKSARKLEDIFRDVVN
ncbi:glycosyltransferase family 4 protein [Pontiella agarivorans]|uniref:glycosyltransferase family 4 protein n=1 Tax=Pontiella agarivorans TaxID=3038953 RepID=UPI002AD47900|nr:glycosyltransferase family 1 protein [Pontiella agarivorans]